MTFNEQQKADLAAPLNRAHVKPPAPGKHGDYIEGWRVIDEANRIFGFDGWSRETVHMFETSRTQNGEKWNVSYVAKVRVSAGGIVREGTGCGSGDGMKNLGDAIESAIKEAETDAMKRALMTFGNPFGLALYDKKQTNVQTMPEEAPASVQIALDAIDKLETVPALQKWWTDNNAGLPDSHYDAVLNAFNARLAAVRQMDKVAA